MGAKIAMCVDEEICSNPEIIGLEGEALDAQPWLDVYTSGEEARSGLSLNGESEELWVLSCSDVEPINLAASVKADKPQLKVRLVTPQPCGSLFSRAHTAAIDEVIDQNGFPRRYAQVKQTMQTPVELVVMEPEVSAPVARLLQPQAQPGLTTTAVESRAFVLTVVSGSGGAGKSAVSSVGALIASEWGHKTLLLDCDLQFGDVAAMVGAAQPLYVDDVAAHPERLEAESLQPGGLVVIAAPRRLEASEEVVRHLPALLDRVSRLFDVVVVNTGASWAEQHAVLLERSSVALFLVDQRVSSVRACRHALELCARCGIAASPFQYALNRCAKGAPLTSIDVSSALQGAPVFELKDGGRDVEDYLSGGAARELIEVRNEFAKSLERVMERLLPGRQSSPRVQTQAADEKRPLRRRARHVSGKRGRRQA